MGYFILHIHFIQTIIMHALCSIVQNTKFTIDIINLNSNIILLKCINITTNGTIKKVKVVLP